MIEVHKVVGVILILAGFVQWFKADEEDYARKAYGVALIVLGSLPG